MDIVERFSIPGVIKITPKRLNDDRGFFSETWKAARFHELGLDAAFIQDNHSHSVRAGTVRGLHAQRPPFAQRKLVRVVRGRILDVAVDVRVGSPHYGRWMSTELSADNGAQLWVPRGFLHGFATLEPDTDVLYKVDAPYDAACEIVVRFDDPDLAVDWGMPPDRVILSAKDAGAQAFRDFVSPFRLEGAA